MVAAVAGIGRNAERMITRLAGTGKNAAKSRLEIRQRLLQEIDSKPKQSQRYYTNERLHQMFAYIEKKFSSLPDFIRKPASVQNAAKNPKVKTFAQRVAECNDEKTLKRLNSEISKKMAKLEKDGVKDLLEKDFKSLTPEQQAKVREYNNYKLAGNILERKGINVSAPEVEVKQSAKAADTAETTSVSASNEAVASEASKEGKKTPWGWIIGCTAGGLGLGSVAGASANNHKLDAVA